MALTAMGHPEVQVIVHLTIVAVAVLLPLVEVAIPAEVAVLLQEAVIPAEAVAVPVRRSAVVAEEAPYHPAAVEAVAVVAVEDKYEQQKLKL